MLDKFPQPSQRQLGSVIAVIRWVTRLAFEELGQLDNDVAIKFEVARLRLLKVLQELFKLIVTLLAEFTR